MRRWRQVGSVGGSNHSRSLSQHRSARSKHDSPFHSFHQNLQNKSQQSLDSPNKAFCQEYMERNKSLTQNITIQMAHSQRRTSKKAQEDMFTEMRNLTKRQPSLVSRDSVKTTSERQSRIESGSSKLNKRERLEKTGSKLQGLKKEQKKLMKSMETQTAAIKNIFCQIDEVFHRFANKTQQTQSSGNSGDPQLFKEIVLQAVSIQKYFAEMDRKKQQIMHGLDS